MTQILDLFMAGYRLYCSMIWKGGELNSAHIKAEKAQKVSIRFKAKIWHKLMKAGEVYKVSLD